MRQSFRIAWSKTRAIFAWHRIVIAGLILALALLAWGAYLRFALGYDWAEWTGLRGRSFAEWVGLAEFTRPIENYERGKTLWDWLELLIIPIVLALSALWFNWQERKSDRELLEKRHRTDREIAENRQQESALQIYLDKMTDLLLEKNLRTSAKDSDVRAVARARTLTTLKALDPGRKSTLIRFLIETKLIQGPENIISLERANLEGVFILFADLYKVNLADSVLVGSHLAFGSLKEANLFWSNLTRADLSESDLSGANLSGSRLKRANLQGANLRGANLEKASLERANLERADLREANLHGVYLEGANLQDANLDTEHLINQAATIRGATMPDGTVHD